MREKKINKFMAGCGQRYGGNCTCGDLCKCNHCPKHPKIEDKSKIIISKMIKNEPNIRETDNIKRGSNSFNQSGNGIDRYQDRDFAQSSTPKIETQGNGSCCGGYREKKTRNPQNDIPATVTKRETYGRRASLQSAGGSSFGRAMSALSELSIDWDDMDDFDMNLDHSANIKPISVEHDEAPPPDTDSAVESIFEVCP